MLQLAPMSRVRRLVPPGDTTPVHYYIISDEHYDTVAETYLQSFGHRVVTKLLGSSHRIAPGTYPVYLEAL